MNTPPETTVSPGADSRPAVASPLAPVSVTVQTSNAPAASPEKASRPAARPAKVAAQSKGSPVSSRTSEHFSPDVEASPAATGMTPDQIALAFAGVAAEEPPTQGRTKRETPTEEEEEIDNDDVDTDGTHEGRTDEEEGESAEEVEEESEEEAESEEEVEAEAEGDRGPLDGIVKAMSAKGLGKLAKRVTEVFTENGKLKALAAEKPLVLPAAEAALPLATARTVDEVEAQAEEMRVDARKYLRWLNRHPEGGTWQEGDQTLEMSAEEVESSIDYWERTLDTLPKAVEARKSYLTQYAETVKTLETPASEILNPKVATRESKLIRSVPELTRVPDYLQLLADAAAGRVLREKKAAGQVPVYVDAAKAKAKRAAAEKGQPAAVDKSRVPPRKQADATSLESLRSLVASGGPGSKAAADKLALLSVGAA